MKKKIDALLALLKEFIMALGSLLPNDSISCKLRRIFYNRCGCSISKGALIYRNVLLLGNVVIGSGSSVSNYSVINGCRLGVAIGRDVMVAPGCCIISFQHGMKRNGIPMSKQPVIEKKVTIHDDVWVGANSTIVSGVTIGKGAVIAANSVVLQDIPEYTIVGGVPAKPLKIRGE